MTDSPEHESSVSQLPTLCAVYTKDEPKLQTDRLFRRAAEAGELALEEDDRGQAVELVLTHDPELLRTRRLVYEAALEANGRYFEPIAQFVLDALPPEVLRDEAKLSLSAETRLGADAARALADTITSGLVDARDDVPTTDRDELRQRRRRFNALMLLLVLVHRRSDLEIDDLAEILTRRLGRAERGTRQTTVRQGVELAQLTDPRLSRERVRERLELVRRWMRSLRDARERLTEADRRGSETARHANELRAENEQLRAQLILLQDELGAAREALIAAKQREAGAQAGGRLDLLEVSGRIENWLTGRMQSQLNVARQALGVTPPRVLVAEEKLEVAIEELEERVRWLRSLG